MEPNMSERYLDIMESLTLAELRVRVRTSFLKLKKLLQNLMKLLPHQIMVW